MTDQKFHHTKYVQYEIVQRKAMGTVPLSTKRSWLGELKNVKFAPPLQSKFYRHILPASSWNGWTGFTVRLDITDNCTNQVFICLRQPHSVPLPSSSVSVNG
jgi:hypothetical protein